MNILYRELKSHKYSLLGWSFGMILLVAAGMAKFSAYQGNGQAVNDLMKQFPKAFLTVFGISGFDLSTISGYFGLLFIYLAVMAAIHAAILGSEIITKEERDRTSEFLFVKPISRNQAILSKMLAAFCNIIVLNIMTLISSIIIVARLNNGDSISHEIVILMIGMFFIQLIFLFAGTAIAGFVKKPKSATGIVTAILLFTYILYSLININDKLNILRFVTPFKYFDANNIINSGLDPFYIVLSIIISAILCAATFFWYKKRDLNV